MQGRCSNKVAVVTGGSQGIGRGITDKLVEEGASVVVGARKPPQQALPEGAVFHALDVADEKSVVDFFAFVLSQHGHLDILVNAAGVMFQKHFLDTTLEDWDRTLAINLRGAFLCSRHAVDLMLERETAAIINIGSVEGLASNPDHAPYAASKGGVHGLTRAIAVDMGQHSIRCNAVCPGWIVTPLNAGYHTTPEEKARHEAALQSLHPMGRLGQPEDIANMVCWLGSDEAQWVTGQEFVVDGGRMAKLSG